MARRNVITTPMFRYKRKAPESPFLGWGYEATRKAHNVTRSKILAKYRSCVAGKLAGKDFANLKAVQEAFREAAHACKIHK